MPSTTPLCPTGAGETGSRGDEGFFCEGPLSFRRKKGAPRAPHQRKPFFLREGPSFRRKSNAALNCRGQPVWAGHSFRAGAPPAYIRHWRRQAPLPLTLSPRKPRGFSCSGARRARRNGGTPRRRENRRARPAFCGGCGKESRFFCERDLLSGERRTLSRSPQESRMGFPVPARGGRAGTEERCGDEKTAAPAPPFAGDEVEKAAFFARGTFFQEKE